MKRLTLLTAAGLLASAPLFAMDGGGVSISGEANFGVKFAESDDDSKSELQFHHEFDVKFSASGTTDGGIGFGGSMTIDNTESVSGRTAVAAPTGYIVTGEEDDGYLDARFGFDTLGLTEGDVIVSGSKNNLSGYEKATVARHVGDYTRTLGIGRTYNAGVGDNSLAGIINLITTDGTSGTTADTLENVVITVGGLQFDVKSAVYKDVDGDSSINASDTIVITLQDDTKVTLTYATDANGTRDGDGAGWQINLSADQAAADAITPNTAEYILADDDFVVNPVTVSGSRLIGDEKVAASEAYIAALSGSITEADSQSVNNHGEVYISMDMHKLTIGSDLDAADKLAGGLKDPGFDGIGIDDVAEGPYGESAADVRYDGDFGVASVAISYGDNAGDAAWAAGFSFNVEPVTFGAGFDSNGVMSVGMGFTQGAIAMNALYSTDSDHDEADNEGFACGSDADFRSKDKAAYSKMKVDACKLNHEKAIANKPDLKNQAFGVDVSYQMSEATSVVLVAAQHKKEAAHLSYAKGRPAVSKADATLANPERTQTNDSLTWSTTSTTVDAFGVGFSHDLGGGATLKAGAGSVDSNAVADLGITMKF